METEWPTITKIASQQKGDLNLGFTVSLSRDGISSTCLEYELSGEKKDKYTIRNQYTEAGNENIGKQTTNRQGETKGKDPAVEGADECKYLFFPFPQAVFFDLGKTEALRN